MDGKMDTVREALETGLRLAHAYEDWDAGKEISEAILSLPKELAQERGENI